MAILANIATNVKSIFGEIPVKLVVHARNVIAMGILTSMFGTKIKIKNKIFPPKKVPTSCDPTTGDCLKCLYNTGGDQCQHCLDGFFGDARIRQCARCVCNHLGTNESAGPCDRINGQCPCFPNVIGLQCDQCAPLHYDLASGKGKNGNSF
jgi:hypothetical protein